jgi:amino acid transporter
MRNLASAAERRSSPEIETHPHLRRELGLRDLVLAQILCVVGSTWVGVAAKLGRAHLVFWLAAMLLFYLPLAATVILLNKRQPLEGGLYRWARSGFGDLLGFMTAWNLWVYAVICVPTVLYVIPTDIAYFIGNGAGWIPASRRVSGLLILGTLLFISAVAVRGLGLGKWLHNAGSAMICIAYVILLALPLLIVFFGHPGHYEAFPWQAPHLTLFNVAIFGQMTVGGLSGFEYVAIMAGECRQPERTVGRSVLISAPIIAAMFILGTSSVLAFVGNQPINLIGPIPQTFRLALGGTPAGESLARFGISLGIARAVANGSLLFTGLTRLPMTAGWDHFLPGWFTALHPRWKTPVNSIMFVAGLVIVMLVLSMLGVREQETMQLLQNASTVHYGLSYLALFALPLFGFASFRRSLPLWSKIVAAAGLLSTLVAVVIAIHPIIDVSSSAGYAAKIGGTVVVSNALGLLIFRKRSRISPERVPR